MVFKRHCAHRHPDGRACGAPPLLGGDYCRMHDPAHASDVQEGRRLGGTRRRREAVLASAFDFTGLDSVTEIRRVLEIAIFEALGMDNVAAKVRSLISGAHEAAALLKVGELEDRVKALEAAVLAHTEQHDSVFDGPDDLGDPFPGGNV